MYSYKQLGRPASANPLTNRHRRLLIPAVTFVVVLLCFTVPWIRIQMRALRLPIPIDIAKVHKPAAADEWEPPPNWDPVDPVYSAFPKYVPIRLLCTTGD